MNSFRYILFAFQGLGALFFQDSRAHVLLCTLRSLTRKTPTQFLKCFEYSAVVGAAVLFFCIYIPAAYAIDMAKEDASKPIEITADVLEVKREARTAVFSGDVEAIQGRVNLRSDKMTVFYREKKEKQNPSQSSVSKIDVEGNVFLSTPEETAQGNRGTYDVDKKVVHLNDSVLVTKGKNIIKGDHLVYNIATGESEVWSNRQTSPSGKKQRVQSIFVPE